MLKNFRRGHGSRNTPPAAQQTGYQQLPPQGTGYQPAFPQNTGYQPTPPQGTGYQPLFPQNTGYQPVPPQGTGYQPMPPQVTGYQPVPPQGTGYQPIPPQGTGYQPVPPQAPETEQKPRKRLGAFQIAVIVGAVIVVAWYLLTMFMPARTNFAQIKAGMLGARYSGDALIVRGETPYDAEGVTSIRYSAEEGRVVSRGMPICDVYSSGYSTREMTALQDFRDQIRDYQTSLLASETTYDARLARVETDVLSRAKEVRQILFGTRGNLSNQEKLLDTAITARQQYLRQKYANDQRMSRLNDDERAQQQRIDSWTKQYAAVTDSLISFYSDGYEYGLTTGNYTQFTPAEVRRMIGGEKPAASVAKGKTTIYRTIRDGEWKVLMLVRDQNWNPVEGQTYELQLEHFENTTVQAGVDSFTRSGGELLVRLSVASSVTPVLYMRTCQAELGDYIATLMVPARAIYVQDDMQGVVVVDGSNQSFIPIQIVYQDGDNVYVTAVTQGLLFEGQTVRLF